MKRIILLLILLNLSLVSAVPKIVPYVNDYANILSDQEETNLNLLIDSIEKNTTYEIAIVTLENTEGIDRIEYANRIGDENGVGKKDSDNGIIVLWSLENEKGGAIATGRGSEAIFNDAKVGRIGRESRPYFDNQSYYIAFSFIVDELNKEIINYKPNNQTITSSQTQETEAIAMFIAVVGIIVFLFFLGRFFKSSNDGFEVYDNNEEYKPDKSVYKYKIVDRKRKRQYLYGAAATSIINSKASSSSSSSSNSSSSSHSFGGGISFGGGGFGGGGARF